MVISRLSYSFGAEKSSRLDLGIRVQVWSKDTLMALQLYDSATLLVLFTTFLVLVWATCSGFSVDCHVHCPCTSAGTVHAVTRPSHLLPFSIGWGGDVEVPETGEEVFVIDGSFADALGEHRAWSWSRGLARRAACRTMLTGPLRLRTISLPFHISCITPLPHKFIHHHVRHVFVWTWTHLQSPGLRGNAGDRPRIKRTAGPQDLEC